MDVQRELETVFEALFIPMRASQWRMKPKKFDFRVYSDYFPHPWPLKLLPSHLDAAHSHEQRKDNNPVFGSECILQLLGPNDIKRGNLIITFSLQYVRLWGKVAQWHMMMDGSYSTVQTLCLKYLYVVYSTHICSLTYALYL